MTVLVAYGAVEGQSAKIAHFVKGIAKEAGLETRLLDTGKMMGDVSLEGVDKVVLVASVHERRHPKSFETFIEVQREALGARKSLMLSVSLKAASPEGQEEAQDYLAEMLLRTFFKPDVTALVAGAVRPDSYDYFEKEIIRHVVLKDRNVDPRDGIQEFTDWAALEAVLTAFLKE